MNLNDVFPDGLMGEGIFYALNEYNVPWKTAISSVALDLEYYGNVSGGKTIAPLLRRLLVDGVIPPSALTRLANSLYSMNALRWTKLWDTYQLEYNPIENYRMTEIMEDDDTVTTYGRTHRKTGTESDDRTRTDESTDGVFGFNSSSASDSETSDHTIDDDNTHTYDLTDADTGSDTQSHSYELTRSGNIGVTTSQQMIESERSLWMWKYFYDVVFPDVDRMLTISVYSDDVIPITTGGVTPTGEIDITLNGTYDVTEYAYADVQVPNTYTAADEGMVVYNGELVSQIGREISVNGTYDTTLNNALSVNVPNTYTAADEGKVVDNGALVNQGSLNITENGTYDTTLISELTANVSGANILGGTTNPVSAEGSNGDIYIKYTDYDGSAPSGYTLLTYLQSNGNQSIDTGIDINSMSYFELKSAFSSNTNNNNVYGVGWSSKESNILFASGYIYNQVGLRNISANYDVNDHVYKWDSSGIYIDSIAGTANTSNIPTGARIRLFATAYGGTFDSSRISYAKMYYCKMYDDQTLIRDFIPVKRNSDNVLGMYDLVNDVFYINSGTGSFISGEELTGEPIDAVYLKVNGLWKIIENCDWSDIII